MKKLIIKIAFILLIPCFAAATSDDFYGSAVTGQSLANLRIGPSSVSGREVYHRFKADETKSLTSVRVYYIHGGGYSAGSTTDIYVALFADDGTDDHKPTGSALASKSYTHTNENGCCAFETIAFDSAYTVTAGTRYHILFRNVSSNKDTNYCSVDYLYTSTPPSRLFRFVDDDADWGMWKYEPDGSGWIEDTTKNPIMHLIYSDSSIQGQSYVNVGSSGVREVYGSTHKIRELFTVSGSNQSVTGLYVWCWKAGSPATDLLLRLEESDGTEIETITVAKEDVSSSLSWEGGNFSQTHQLSESETYRVVVHTTGGDSSNRYRAYPAQEGDAYSMEGLNFEDGYWQYTTNGSTWNLYTAEYDLMFYFNTETTAIKGVRVE